MPSLQTCRVYADDLSGAAEVAGIAIQAGWGATLLRPSAKFEGAATGDTPFFDLSTRDLDDPASAWAEAFSNVQAGTSCFIKIDSVLRGQVERVLHALLAQGHRLLLLPGNPSQGRICKGGQLIIDGTPIHKTGFAQDPANPAKSSQLTDLIDPKRQLEAETTYTTGTCVTALPGTAITIAQAPDVVAMQSWAAQAAREGRIVIGAADAFQAWLSCIEKYNTKRISQPPADQARLFIAGSAHPRNARWQSELAARGTPINILGEDNLSANVAEQLRTHREAFIFTTGHYPAETDVAHWLASEVRKLLHANPSEDWTLCVDGGATAAALSEALGWQTFAVEHTYASGVVRLKPPQDIAAMIVKPGSYEWPHHSLHPQSFKRQ